VLHAIAHPDNEQNQPLLGNENKQNLEAKVQQRRKEVDESAVAMESYGEMERESFLQNTGLERPREVEPTAFVLRFKGRCDKPPAEACHASANSQLIETQMHAEEGVRMRVTELIGSFAQLFVTELKFTSAGTFTAKANITFGIHLYRPHYLSMETIGEGVVVFTVSGRRNFVATFNVTGGASVFEGSVGTVTVNGVYHAPHRFTALVTGIVYSAPQQQLIRKHGVDFQTYDPLVRETPYSDPMLDFRNNKP